MLEELSSDEEEEEYELSSIFELYFYLFIFYLILSTKLIYYLYPLFDDYFLSFDWIYWPIKYTVESLIVLVCK